MAKTTRKAAPKTKAVASGNDAPETKSTTSAQRKAADKLFENADDAARAGLPPDMTIEQHENHVRRQALGY